jgi:TolB-like protein/cytochrome c-type biogenesis protein CcmH/NrfG
MRLVSELRRRNVFRVAIAYVIIAWLILQVGDTLAPALHLAEWVNTVLAFFLILGLPIALIFAWAYELTPEGLKKEKDVDRSQSITHITGRKFDYLIIAVLALALGYFAFDKFVLDPSRDAELVQTTTEAVTEQAIESGNAEAADKSIAVLPFRNRSAVAEDVYFVDGIHDDILTQLAKLSSFGKVISRTSMEQYRETSKTMPQIGQELGVATILEGGVQRAGDKVHINLQLIEAATDEHLWAETYDRRLTVENIFLVQEEIARDVAKALRLTLTSQENESLAKIPTTSLEAYRLYQLGRQETYKRTAESSERATEYFEEAIRSDPDYAQAYAGLADAHMNQHFDGGLSRKEALTQARPMAERAIQLDPTLAEGYVALGNINSWDRQPAAAESNFKTAIALSPGLTSARTVYGSDLVQLFNRYDEAIIQLEEAARLSPRDPLVHVYLGEAYAKVHRNQDALETVHHALNLDPDNPRIYESLGDLYGLSMGRLDEAIKWFSMGLQRDPSSVRLRPVMVFIHLDLGNIPTARLLIEQQIDLANQGQISVELLQMALLVYSGRYEEALQFAEEAWRLHQWGITAHFLATLYSLNGQYQRALEINDQRIALFDITPHPETKVTAANLRRAIDRAAILVGMGENARAQRLLKNCLKVAKTASNSPWFLSGNFRLVQIYALLGDVPNALLALRASIDEGIRSGWRIDLLHSPITASLRSEPRFQEMVEEIRADMATQLANVREMQRTGEMPPLPAIDR